MRALIFFFFLILFSTGDSIGDESPNECNITLFPSRNGHVGQFETVLNNALRETEGFFERGDVKYGTEIFAIGLESVIGPVAQILPIIQDALGSTRELMAELSAVLSKDVDRLEVTRDITTINDNVRLFSSLLGGLNETLIANKGKEISPNNLQIDLARYDASYIQIDIMKLNQKLSNGDSPLWTHPKLVVGPLFALMTLITLFTPIRNILNNHTIDKSIISCQMAEILNDYRPSILYWRLAAIGDDRGDGLVFDLTYNPEKYQRYLETARNARCSRSLFSGSDCHTDKLQPKLPYCVSNVDDYYFMVRSQVEDVFNSATTEMEKTCSDAQRTRLRFPTGYGWWSFKKLVFGAFGEGSVTTIFGLSRRADCDMWLSEDFCSKRKSRCDPYVQILIDGELDKQTATYEDTPYGEITMDYRTKLVHETTNITFVMMDADSPDPDDELLRKTFTVRDLMNQKRKRIYADQRADKGGIIGFSDNFIELYELVWKDDFKNP